MCLTIKEQPELLQYKSPKGDVIRFTSHSESSKLGHYAVYYTYVDGWWVYSGMTADPIATVQAWTKALGDEKRLPQFFFGEVVARVEELV